MGAHRIGLGLSHMAVPNHGELTLGERLSVVCYRRLKHLAGHTVPCRIDRIHTK
jgi:hypothetical protein